MPAQGCGPCGGETAPSASKRATATTHTLADERERGEHAARARHAPQRPRGERGAQAAGCT